MQEAKGLDWDRLKKEKESTKANTKFDTSIYYKPNASQCNSTLMKG